MGEGADTMAKANTNSEIKMTHSKSVSAALANARLAQAKSPSKGKSVIVPRRSSMQLLKGASSPGRSSLLQGPVRHVMGASGETFDDDEDEEETELPRHMLQVRLHKATMVCAEIFTKMATLHQRQNAMAQDLERIRRAWSEEEEALQATVADLRERAAKKHWQPSSPLQTIMHQRQSLIVGPEMGGEASSSKGPPSEQKLAGQLVAANLAQEAARLAREVAEAESAVSLLHQEIALQQTQNEAAEAVQATSTSSSPRSRRRRQKAV